MFHKILEGIKMKKLLSLLVLFVVGLLAVSTVSADALSTVQIEQLKINGKAVGEQENFYVEEGQELELEIKLYNQPDNDLANAKVAEDIEVEAEIDGYEYSDHESLQDTTPVFDLEEGDTRWVELSLTLPKKLDKDLYLLRLSVSDKNSQEVTTTYNLKVNPARHGLAIADVVFSPGTTITAGRSLLATVLVDNFGGKDEEDVKVTLDIPELGVSASDYVEKVESDDKKTSEELFLRLPSCAQEGDYQAKVTLQYNEYDTASKDFTLHVVADDKCQVETQKLVITVGPETQNVVANQAAAYPVALTNAGTSAKTYVLELATGDWATAQLSESLVVLEPGKTKVVFAYLTAKDMAAAGEKIATLNVKSGDNVLKTIYLKANVVPQQAAASSFNLRNSLEIALIVLVVVLVIVGLVLGFSRMKKDEEGEEKTYY